MIAFLTSKLGMYVTGTIAVFIAFVASYFKGKSKGKNEAFTKAAEKTSKLLLDAAAEREDVRAKFQRMREDFNSKSRDK